MNRPEYIGNIASVRAVEDCIRATKKYTEGIGTMRKKHPIQGEEFPSKVFCKFYEVYPSGPEVGWEMPAGVAIDWLWGEYKQIDVLFKYDYRVNEAEVMIKDGVSAVKELSKAIPGFSKALDDVRRNGKI